MIIDSPCALHISRAGALLLHMECTSLGNSWELPCLLLCDPQKISVVTCVHDPQGGSLLVLKDGDIRNNVIENVVA